MSTHNTAKKTGTIWPIGGRAPYQTATEIRQAEPAPASTRYSVSALVANNVESEKAVYRFLGKSSTSSQQSAVNPAPTRTNRV